MIWYDASTGEPVAPGSCEDDGPPSIEGYHCEVCNRHVNPYFYTDEIKRYGEEEPIKIIGIGTCPLCGSLLLTTG